MNSSSISRFPSNSGSLFRSSNSNLSNSQGRRLGKFISETFENFDSDDSDDDYDQEQPRSTAKTATTTTKNQDQDQDQDEEEDPDEIKLEIEYDSKFKSKHIDPLFRKKAERWRRNDFSDNSDSEYERLSSSEVYLHSYQNGNAVLVVFEKRPYDSSTFKDLPNITLPSQGENREALIKSATSLIDDTRLNIKMRTLKKKMQEAKNRSQARKEKQDKTEETPGTSNTVKLPEIPKTGRKQLLSANPMGFPNLTKSKASGMSLGNIQDKQKPKPPAIPKPKAMVNHNHEKF